jgi:hypothetical protein
MTIIIKSFGRKWSIKQDDGFASRNDEKYKIMEEKVDDVLVRLLQKMIH